MGLAGYGNDGGVAIKFTGKERDAETGLDYFGARYMSAAQGRFTSPDPKLFSTRTIGNPQKWNRYAYVLNNPLVFIDPDGLEERINIFYTVSGNFRNYVQRGNTRVTTPGPDWAKLQSSAAKKGFEVLLHKGGTFSAGDIANSTKNAFATVIIGHGNMDPNLRAGAGSNKGWVSTHLEVKGEAITPNGVVSMKDGSATGPSPGVTNTLCLLTCNSSDRLGGAFSMAVGSTVVTNDGGRDGLTNIGTLEVAGFNIVNGLVAGQSVDQAVQTGQTALNQSTLPNDQGDKLNVEKKKEPQ
ncbi:MAG: RHS repeat-associated core domain-containing protein [Acidobacteria bacterium]|nr:RHS repeat-associated core domain-containing protein [Acidobacteriota bacterium]